MKKRGSLLFVTAMLVIMVLSVTNIFAVTGAIVQCFNGNTSASANTISVNLKFLNTGDEPIGLSNVKLRYYFTNDGTQTNGFACDWASANNTPITSYVNGTFGAIPALTNADRYLEIGFSSAEDSLAAGAGAEVKIRIWKSDWSNFTQTNDYSFNASASNYVDWTAVTAYISGILYWGIPVDSGVATVTPTIINNTPTPTQSITPTPTQQLTVTPTSRPTVTRRATSTRRVTPTRQTTPTRRVTPTVTQSFTPTVTRTATPTPIQTVTVTPTNTATPTPTQRATPTPTTPQTTTGFVSRIGTRLALDGKTFYFNGTNQYYLFYKSHAMVDEVLEDAQRLGLKVMRTWGFCDGKVLDGFCFQPSSGVYDEKTFQNMDYTISKAKQCGIKLIIPLVNNWDDMGGMNQYVAWAGGGSHDDFYTNATCKSTYKNYVKYFLNRVNSITGVAYKDDPTIMMWELGNEPRCSSDTTGAKLQAWIDEMAAYIKSLDSKHLLGTGQEGFYNGAEGSNYIKNNQNPNIDVCSAHLYPGYWSLSEAQALTWISDHANDAHNVIGKPFYLGEFGWVANQTSSSSIAKRDQVYTDWYNMLNSTNSDGAMFWLLSGHQDDGTLYPDYDTFTVYYPENSSTNTVISNYSKTVAAKSGIIFDNTAPSASIASPVNNASVSGMVTIAGTAIDNNALSKVEVSIDGGIYRPATGTASWTYSWDTTKLVNGNHTITVKATDVQNNTATSQISVVVTGSSPAGVWTITGYKSKDDGYWFTYYIKALNASGAAQTGHYVFRFYIAPEGTMSISGHYDNSTVYNSNVTAGNSFAAYYGTTRYYEIDLGTRTINAGDYVGYFGTFGQSDGKMLSANDWSSSEFPTAYGTVTHMALYKDSVLVGGLNP